MVASYETALQTRTQRHDGASQLDRVDRDDPPYHVEFLARLNISERPRAHDVYDLSRL
jgi:hypothetical protein